MATSFTINKLDFANTPSAPEVWTFEYKVYTNPDSSYILISNSSAVAVNGNLSVPLVVTGLTAGQLYYVRATNNCGSPPLRFIQQIKL
jgi:hypothetical protein